MTDFDDMFASAFSSFETMFGEALTVTDPGATNTAVTGMASNPVILNHIRIVTFTIPVEDIATIKRGYTITAGSTVYTVETADSRDGTWVCEAHAPEEYEQPSLGVLS